MVFTDTSYVEQRMNSTRIIVYKNNCSVLMSGGPIVEHENKNKTSVLPVATAVEHTDSNSAISEDPIFEYKRSSTVFVNDDRIVDLNGRSSDFMMEPCKDPKGNNPRFINSIYNFTVSCWAR